jgi:hypothetical protein
MSFLISEPPSLSLHISLLGRHGNLRQPQSFEIGASRCHGYLLWTSLCQWNGALICTLISQSVTAWSSLPWNSKTRKLASMCHLHHENPRGCTSMVKKIQDRMCVWKKEKVFVTQPVTVWIWCVLPKDSCVEGLVPSWWIQSSSGNWIERKSDLTDGLIHW